MGMLYYSCPKCGRGCGIQAQFIGNVNCQNCGANIEPKGKGTPRFQTWEFGCDKCNFKVSFESMNCTNVSCIKDNHVMLQLSPILKTSRRSKKEQRKK